MAGGCGAAVSLTPYAFGVENGCGEGGVTSSVFLLLAGMVCHTERLTVEIACRPP